jgi:hypothetical protein
MGRAASYVSAAPLESNEREILPLTCSPKGVITKEREKLQLKWRRIGEKHGLGGFIGTYSRCFARKRGTTDISGNISILLPAPIPFRRT